MITNKILQNAKWIILCKIAQSLIQLVVGMLSARYLGPSNYGLINYATSVVAFAIPVMQLGFQATLVQEYVDDPTHEGEIMGTSLLMNLVAAVACIIGVTTFAMVVNSNEPITILVCMLYSVSLLFQGTEMLQYWFQAKLLSKYSSLAALGAYVVVSAYKIYLLVTGKSVFWFALSHSVEFGATGLFLLAAYRKKGSQRLSFSRSRAVRLFNKSKHYIVAMLMVVVFNSPAGILLKLWISEAENGYYATALTCTSITGFVFLAIIDTARPVILEAKQRSAEQFEKLVSGTYALIIWLSLAQSVGFTICAKLIVWLLYGEDYMSAVPVLQILVWNSAFSYMGYIRNIWILAEQKHKSLPMINFCGAIASLLLNMALIPVWGACGAAFASVLVQIFTNFVMGFILKEIRENNRLLLRGFNPKSMLEILQILI